MKSFCLCFCILAMVLFASSAVEMKEVENVGRCMVVMDPNGCNLLSCKQGCLQQNNGNGVCLANIKEGYKCVCYINC
ncbi:hypothetical protein SLEP1_g20688 [Rubroshorea leprosula]|uniref:Uncharacterized protein n=1 Tax=Rubroshorea leprosula TaxID=152421 RepID=A0AAV5J3H8_9ROSI|nr:hypothetical protein SLEP1_g20688 [Rubroshorea leprosula]